MHRLMTQNCGMIFRLTEKGCSTVKLIVEFQVSMRKDSSRRFLPRGRASLASFSVELLPNRALLAASTPATRASENPKRRNKEVSQQSSQML